ncbi:MAG: hypothetical protein KAQ62_02930 [Cyclobacteriaceae bacterium]|nr:hypothetical protein [Cyclobacteriaceae bacterium]MCK5210238.1 hypothetical protein [Cyclobacteriaceae bacterium]MCK5280164.1 hypothetical protein [Cyclobacteriaceae bacterium]MCK5367470.1 hypothetical protein [Cyclobacteriaceae bacterium]MCK5466853.1 hypothetical protein [Cyclobacteriaceae bacterium]
MLTVFGSLLYMYAYASDRLNFLNTSQDWITELPKAHIFYFGLGVFAIFNLILNVGISMYKNTKGIDNRSILFKSKEQKERLLMWFTYLLAGINFLITSIIIYLAFVKINGVTGSSYYVYIPVTGLIILVGIVVGLVSALIRK